MKIIGVVLVLSSKDAFRSNMGDSINYYPKIPLIYILIPFNNFSSLKSLVTFSFWKAVRLSKDSGKAILKGVSDSKIS